MIISTNLEERQDKDVIVCFISTIPESAKEYILGKLKCVEFSENRDQKS